MANIKIVNNDTGEELDCSLVTSNEIADLNLQDGESYDTQLVDGEFVFVKAESVGGCPVASAAGSFHIEGNRVVDSEDSNRILRSSRIVTYVTKTTLPPLTYEKILLTRDNGTTVLTAGSYIIDLPVGKYTLMTRVIEIGVDYTGAGTVTGVFGMVQINTDTAADDNTIHSGTVLGEKSFSVEKADGTILLENPENMCVDFEVTETSLGVDLFFADLEQEGTTVAPRRDRMTCDQYVVTRRS